MKNRYFPSLAALAVLLFLPFAANAQTITTLLSQNFSGATFPPTGWSASNTASGNQSVGIGGGASVAWYRSAAGNGGSGGIYGSAVANGMDAYQYGCYGSPYNGYSINPVSLTAPTINLSGFPAVDSQFVDFDAFIPINGYQTGNNTNLGSHFYVRNGATSFYDFTVTTTSNGTVYTGLTSPSDPANYTASTYWKHFHLLIPQGTSSLSLTFFYDMYYTPCYYGYWYADNIGITNVVVTDYHYTFLTVTGPTSINFGTVPFQQSAGPQYTHLTNPNTNTSAITLSSFVFGGANPGDFSAVHLVGGVPQSLTALSSFAIPPGGTDSIGITYSPQGTGSRSGTLTFSSNGAIPPSVTITLSGTGVAPTVSYSATKMFVGVSTELTDTSGTQYLYVNSTGAVPLTIQSVSLIGLDASAYFITHVPRGPIAAGGVGLIGVRFFPDIEGVPQAQMVIASNASNKPLDTVTMNGVGILPHLVVSSSNAPAVTSVAQYLPVNFDSVTLGTDSCLTLLLSNPGSDTLAIEKSYFSSADPDFSFTPLTGSADTLIAPGGVQPLQVCFNPVQEGYRTATLRLLTNIPRSKTPAGLDTNSYAIVIRGTGVPVGHLAITGPATNGITPLAMPACVTDTFWNTGASSLWLDTITFTGPNAADFSGTSQKFPILIGANSFWTYQVCAAPHDTGAETAVLTGVASIGEPSTQSATLNLSVYGTRVGDTLVISGAFPTPVCGTDTATITVTNTGNVATQYAASVAGGTNPADFSVLPAMSPLESGGGVATFKVAFTPSTAGNETTNFNIAGGGNGTLVLTATGGAATIAGSGTAPTVGVGAPAETFTATINNTGTCPWTPGPASVTSPFAYVGGGTTPIAPNGSTTDTFTFTAPSVAGTSTQTVGFTSAVGTSIPAANVVINGTANSAGVATVSAINGYSLDQNYPNPFGGESTVEITLPTGGMVQFNIINVEGQVVESILNRHFDAGTFEVKLNADGLSSGTYYYQMTSGDVILTRQMEVIK